MNMLFIIFLMLFLLMSISFLTLLEQKVLSYLQIRKGPNKVSLLGLLQPISDAIKLFSKEYSKPNHSNYKIFYFSPIIALMIALTIWLMYPFMFKYLSFNLSFLFMLACLSLGVYPMMLAGWSSNSNYSLLGSLRSIAQTISYEVCLILMFMSYLILILNLNMFMFYNYQKYIMFMYINIPITCTMLIIFLAETNRAPFDFAEGESELVSGFNVEYSSGAFALIFLAEYCSILFMSAIFCLLFLNSNQIYFIFFFKILLMSFFFIWIRGSFPRYRYDMLMYLTWKKYLPISLNFMFFFLCIFYFLSI